MTVPVNSAITARYNLGPVKPWVEAAAYYLGPKYNIKTIGGWRPSDPFPDHPSGHALDFMITSNQQGDALAQDAIANYQALGVKYVIWNRRYWSPSTGWEPYTATSNPHTDHVHITFNDTPGTGLQGLSGTGFPVTTVSTVSNPIVEATCAWKVHKPIGGGDMCVASKVQVRSTVGGLLILSGAAVFVFGAILLVAYGLSRTDAGRAVASVVPAGRIARLGR